MTDLNPASILFDKSGNAISSFSDGTYNRICVDTRPTLGVEPQQLAWGVAPGAQTIIGPLTNGSATALNVNGSSTAQVFSYKAGTKAISIYAVRIAFSFTTVTFNGSNFGAAAITNGLALSVTSVGVTATVFTLKTNEDFFFANSGGSIVSGGSGILMTATVIFNQPLVASSTDQVAVTVSDNLALANILYGKAQVFGIRSA